MEFEKVIAENPLSRRDAIKLGGAAILALTGCGSTTPESATKTRNRSAGTPMGPTCQKATNVTRGPYFVDEKSDPNISGDVVDAAIPMRSDIRPNTSDGSEGSTEIQPGLPLSLKLVIGSYSSNGTCAPLTNAQVDIWHCNAQGVYSDIDPGNIPPPGSSPGPSPEPAPSLSPLPTASPSAAPSGGPAPGPINGGESTVGQDFLRGYQITDASGAVTFQTIYPGWYSGRAVHIHIKVRVFDASGNVTSESTTQLFFNDLITNVVYLSNPAYQRTSMRDTLNASDMIFLSEKPPLLVNLTGTPTTGYSASVNLGVQVGTIFGG
jgi:protocatechuate 3,4-dioxygenase beta subunit